MSDNLSIDMSGELLAEVRMITPELAAELLRYNRRNRKINDRLVRELVRQILAGEFFSNGESVKLSWPVESRDEEGGAVLDADGEPVVEPILLDGQHRLTAVVEAGVPVEILLVTGVDPEGQSTIDTGRKRTVSDAMRMDGEKEYTQLGAILGGIWKWNAGDRKFNPNPKPTPIEAQRLLASDEEAIRRSLDVGLQTGHAFPDLTKSSLAVAHYLISKVDQEHLPYFFRLIATGTNLSKGHPVLALRNRASSYRRTGQPMPMRRQVGLIIRAWNRCVEGAVLSTIVQSETDAADEPLNPLGAPIPLLSAATFEEK